MNLYNMLLCMGNAATTTGTTGEDGTATGGGSWWMIIIYVVIFGALIYFMMIRPSRKQKKQQEETQNSMEPGDSVLTTSGFYGTIVSVNGDTVIVEFGNNKNCRIPMARQAISQVEKAGSAGSVTSSEAAPVKKFFGRKKEQAAETETAEITTENSQSSEDQDASESTSESSDSNE